MRGYSLLLTAVSKKVTARKEYRTNGKSDTHVWEREKKPQPDDECCMQPKAGSDGRCTRRNGMTDMNYTCSHAG